MPREINPYTLFCILSDFVNKCGMGHRKSEYFSREQENEFFKDLVEVCCKHYGATAGPLTMKDDPGPNSEPVMEITVNKNTPADGGFAAHISNDRDQKWIITPSQSKQVLRLRLRKDGFWWYHSMRFRISEKPVKFYDHNF